MLKWGGGGDFKNGKVYTLFWFGRSRGKGRKGEEFGDGEFSPNCAKLSKLRRKWAEIKGACFIRV